MTPGKNIRSFFREELEKLRSLAIRGKGPFTVPEVDEEIRRREEIKRLREDNPDYPKS
jgi:hypothetical protein